jgi:hypothetical protein
MAQVVVCLPSKYRAEFKLWHHQRQTSKNSNQINRAGSVEKTIKTNKKPCLGNQNQWEMPEFEPQPNDFYSFDYTTIFI